MTTYNWPAPEARPTVPLTWGKWVLGFIGLFAVGLIGALAIIGPEPEEKKASAPGIYARAGWTAHRAVDLEFDLRRDAGFSEARANCAMRAIVGSTTWLEWRALSDYGQLVVIRNAEAGCR